MKKKLVEDMTRKGASQSGSDLFLAAWIMLERHEASIALEIVLSGLLANGNYDKWTTTQIFEALEKF